VAGGGQVPPRQEGPARRCPGRGPGAAERSGGVWQPSPGSVYPALQQLEDEGLIQAETPEGGRRRYALTADGREYVDTHADEVRAPWDDVAGSVGSDAIELRHLIGQLAMAAVQVVQVGNQDQVAQARKILTDGRRKLYAILAAEEGSAEEESAEGEPAAEQ
jgi:DNA-binding PadR family transcriptional regulator